MAINRASEVRELFPGLHAIAGTNYDIYDKEHEWIYDVMPSNQAFEIEVIRSGFGLAEIKPEGQAVLYDNLAAEAWEVRYEMITVALAFAITQEAIEDNLYEKEANDLAQELGRSMAITKQILAASVINNAFALQSYSPDGKAMCATDHPLFRGGTQSNRPTVGTDLSETALEAADVAIMAFVDDAGKLIQARPRSVHVPAALKYVAERIFKSTLRPATADNDINALKSIGTYPEFYVHHYFTDSNAWFVKTDVPHGLKFFQRLARESSMEPEFETGNERFKNRERYGYGYTNYRGIWGSPGST